MISLEINLLQSFIYHAFICLPIYLLVVFKCNPFDSSRKLNKNKEKTKLDEIEKIVYSVPHNFMYELELEMDNNVKNHNHFGKHIQRYTYAFSDKSQHAYRSLSLKVILGKGGSRWDMAHLRISQFSGLILQLKIRYIT